MKQVILTFCLSFCIVNPVEAKTNANKVAWNQLMTYGSAGVLGLITGALGGYVDKEIFPLLGFFGEPSVREAVLKDYCESLELWGHKLSPHRQLAMHYIAWLASWCGYLCVMKCAHHHRLVLYNNYYTEEMKSKAMLTSPSDTSDKNVT